MKNNIRIWIVSVGTFNGEYKTWILTRILWILVRDYRATTERWD
jgi:hypothetical protein